MVATPKSARKSSRSRGASPRGSRRGGRSGSPMTPSRLDVEFTQPAAQTASSVSPFTGVLDESKGHDKYSVFLYRPHFIIALVFGAAVLYVANFSYEKGDLQTNTKRGLLGSTFAFLLYSSLPAPPAKTIFSRPHPLVWRVVTGTVICYYMALTFLLFQSVDDARWLVTFVDPCHNGLVECSDGAKVGLGLGKPQALPERSYADQCVVWTGGAGCRWWADMSKKQTPCFANIQGAVQDEFFFAHIVGWWGKALILRHAGAAWINSIAFEFIELSFQHWMPNFAECWWDHIILDVLLCNALGIFLGHVFIHYFEVKQYRWMNISGYSSSTAKVKRLAEQFMPESWDSYDWHSLESPKRLLVVLLVYCLILLQDFNAFALKYILWMPPRNPLNTYRLVLWWLLGMMAVREFYEYTTNRAVKRLGHNAWLGAMILTIEVLIWVKFGREANEFKQPFPQWVVVFWTTALVVFAGWFYVNFYVVPERVRRESRGRVRN